MDITFRSIKNINQPHGQPHRLITLMLSWGATIFRISYQIQLDHHWNTISAVDSNIYPETTKLLSSEEKQQIQEFIHEYLYEEGVKNGKTSS